MARPVGKWWWVPGTLAGLAGMLFMLATAVSGHPAWLAVGVLFLVAAGLNLRRRGPAAGAAVRAGTSVRP